MSITSETQRKYDPNKGGFSYYTLFHADKGERPSWAQDGDMLEEFGEGGKAYVCSRDAKGRIKWTEKADWDRQTGGGSDGDSGSSLPSMTGKNGKVLGVTLDAQEHEQIEWVTPSGGDGLPDVTSDDNGKVLTVVDDEWGATAPEKAVFWIDASLDLQTISVSNISCSCAEAEAAAADDRLVKIRLKYYTSPSTYEIGVGELRTLQPYNNYNKLIFDTIFLMADPNGGGGFVVVYVFARFNSDDTMTCSMKLLNSTDMPS